MLSNDKYIPPAINNDNGNATTKNGIAIVNPMTNIGRKNIHIKIRSDINIAQRKSIVYIYCICLIYMYAHGCIINCKFPNGFSVWRCKEIIRSIIYPTLEEFGYVMPEEQMQKEIISRHGDGDKPVSMYIYLTDEEAIKTASIRAEWKPLEATVTLDKKEKRALRKMSRKRQRDGEISTECHICLENCVKPTTISCDHTFCYECITRWLGIKRNCPVCHVKINVQKSVRKKRFKLPDKKISR